MRVGRPALEGLRAKYGEMLTMRVRSCLRSRRTQRRSGRGWPSSRRRIPGALREIDDLELDEIRRRIDALDEVLHGRREVEPWMEAVALFHGLARGALVREALARAAGSGGRAVVRVFEAASRICSVSRGSARLDGPPRAHRLTPAGAR